MKSLKIFYIIIFYLVFQSCNSEKKENIAQKQSSLQNTIEYWITKNDETEKLSKQSKLLVFEDTPNEYSQIEVDEKNTFQTIDGFGFTLTGGSAQVINQLNEKSKKALLHEIFGKNENSISVNYLRISVGASDLNDFPFSYNDLPKGKTDVLLKEFSLKPDLTYLIPLLKEILIINPDIKIMASPWSAPKWMKDNQNTIGGSLKPEYYKVYANYLVKYIQSMKEEGIVIDAITPQNEPLHPGNNPSMLMSALEQADFIKNHLGPAFAQSSIKTKIVVYDHNCNKPEYPITVLKDQEANKFIDGSAFHLYEGEISALSTVHEAFPNKNLYFTEQYTASNGNFGEDLKWHTINVVIGSMRNWSKTALEWNLANNALYEPHTEGGCTTCKGALTILNTEDITRNVSYYIIAHASKFVPSGSVRISSTNNGKIQNVAFKTPQGKYVLIAINAGSSSETFSIKFNHKWATTELHAGDVGTYIW